MSESSEPTWSRQVERPVQYPCSLAQMRFWVLDQLDPGNPSLNVAVRWRLEGMVTTAELEAAWGTILDRHQVLRSRFVRIDGEPLQVVGALVSLRIREVDLTDLSAAAAEEMAERLAVTEAGTPFNLALAPLIRLTRILLAQNVSVLLVTAHHIVCDGWSIGILAHEMGEICAARQAGRIPALPVLALQYGEYALWQRDWLATVPLVAETSFWTRTLAGMRPFELLTDHPRKPVQSWNADIASILLDRELSDRLAQLARSRGCTLFMAAFSALLVLLHRYSGETDIALGTQIAGREEIELEDLVGLFINTLILRGDVSGDPSFAELLARSRRVVTDAFGNSRLPLEQLIEIAGQKRDISRNSLFSVNFIFQRSFIETRSYGSFRLVDMPSRSAGALYDLNFFMVERPEGWRVSCEYNTDLFDQSTISGMLRRFQNLVAGAVADPSCPVSALPLLDEADRQLLLVTRNRTAAPYPQATLPELFDLQAGRSPQATAVVCGESNLSYAELAGAVDRLAQSLRAQGLGAGRRIGVMVGRSPALVVALLAVLKAGSAYVPLDPSYPTDRLAHVIADAELSALLVDAGAADIITTQGVKLLRIDATGAVAADLPGLSARRFEGAGPKPAQAETPSESIPAADPAVLTSPGLQDLAYVIYTSGSTGRPKGVQIGHRALVNLLWAMRDRPGLGPEDTLLAVTTIAFDIAALEIFLPLIVGARLVIAREHEVIDGVALRGLLARHLVSVMQATPITWQMLIEAGWSGVGKSTGGVPAREKGARGLRMLCGGEALPRALAEQLLASGGELWNLYGPTETTIWSSALRVTSGQGPVPIGPPIANTRFYVLDSHRNLASPGVPGELAIGGDGVAQGYLGLPELTADRFIPDRFSLLPGARLYRTGDLVRQRDDLAIEYLGRSDHQIKLRGFRIELGEIEAVLADAASVQEAVAVAGRDASGEAAIWAYAVPGDPTANEAELLADLRARLEAALPTYMQPAALVLLPALPRTPNGKIDRNALPPPAQLASAMPPGTAQGLTEAEAQLALIWSAVLGRPVADPSADFFDLGGHSLLAARMLARVEAAFDRRISLATLLRTPRLDQLARLLSHARPREFDFRQVVTLQQGGTRPPLIALNNTGIFYPLARLLGPDQPFVALQLFDPAYHRALEPRPIEAIAADYVALIRQVQPDGRCAVLGWCVAGTLAFEVARQLAQAGGPAPEVFIIDTWVPGYLRRLPRWRARLADLSYRWKKLRADWSRLRSGEQDWNEFLALHRSSRRLAAFLRRAKTESASAEPAYEDAERYDDILLRHLQAACDGFEPQPYSGRVVLFRARQEPHGAFLDYALGWAPFVTGGLEVVTIAGNHYTMFRDEGVRQMAEAVTAALTRKNEAGESDQVAATL